jgi:hypothetical protein
MTLVAGTTDVADVAVDGRLAIAASGPTIVLLDLAELDAPVEVGSLALGPLDVAHVALRGHRAWAALHSGEVYAIDVSDRSRPRIVGSAATRMGDVDGLAAAPDGTAVAALGPMMGLRLFGLPETQPGAVYLPDLRQQ